MTDSRLTLWDWRHTDSGPVASVPLDSPPSEIAWDQKGDRLAVVFDREERSVRIFDRRGKEVTNFSAGGGVIAAAFHPKRDEIALSVEGALEVWDLSGDQPARTHRWEQPWPIRTINYDPAGERLAVNGREASVRVLDAEDGTQLLTLRGHKEAVLDVRFTSDGSALLSFSAGGDVIRWQAKATDRTP